MKQPDPDEQAAAIAWLTGLSKAELDVQVERFQADWAAFMREFNYPEDSDPTDSVYLETRKTAWWKWLGKRYVQ